MSGVAYRYLELVAKVQVLQSDLKLHMHIVALGRYLLFVAHAPKPAKAWEAATPKESAQPSACR